MINNEQPAFSTIVQSCWAIVIAGILTIKLHPRINPPAFPVNETELKAPCPATIVKDCVFIRKVEGNIATLTKISLQLPINPRTCNLSACEFLDGVEGHQKGLKSRRIRHRYEWHQNNQKKQVTHRKPSFSTVSAVPGPASVRIPISWSRSRSVSALAHSSPGIGDGLSAKRTGYASLLGRVFVPMILPSKPQMSEAPTRIP